MRDANQPGERGPQLLPHREDALELREPSAPLVECALFLRVHRSDRSSRERADAPRLEVREPFEHRELCARLLEGHGRDSDDTGF